MTSREMQAAENERAVIEAYLEEHQLDAALNDAVNAIVKSRPPDPLVELASTLSNASKAAHRVLDVTAREVLSGTSFPALEVTVTTQRGQFSATTALPPYDGDDARYKGRGMRKAADSVRTLLLDKLVGKDVLAGQEAIDKALGADANAPANAVLACSIACVKAGAKHADISVYEYVARIAGVSEPAVPMPIVTLLCGGGYASNPGQTRLCIEEVCAMPVGADSFDHALAMCASTAHALPDAIAAAGLMMPMLGRRGALALSIEESTQALNLCKEAAIAAGVLDPKAPPMLGLGAGEGEDGGAPPSMAMLMGPKVRFVVDVGAPKFAAPLPDDDTVIMYETSRFASANPAPEAMVKKTTDEMVELYAEWLGGRHPVVGIEDPFATADMTAFIKLKEKVDQALQAAVEAGAPDEDENGDVMETDGKYADDIPRLGQIGGDSKCFVQVMGELVCNDASDIAKYDEMQGLNTLVLTLRKGKTVSGAVELCKKAQAQGWGVVVAAEPEAGETDDVFISHFAVGVRAGQFKGGGLEAMEHVAKYNELARIAGDVKKSPMWVGQNFRNLEGSS